MRVPMTAEEARAMADNNQNQFVNTWAMRRVLRYVKKKARQGYYSCCIEVYKDETELIRANLEKLGYQARIEKSDYDERRYAHITW